MKKMVGVAADPGCSIFFFWFFFSSTVVDEVSDLLLQTFDISIISVDTSNHIPYCRNIDASNMIHPIVVF